MYKEAQADLLRLSVAIARRIVHRELLVSPDILESIVSVVLEKLDRQEVHRVRVHPAMAVRLDQDLKNLPHQRAIQVSNRCHPYAGRLHHRNRTRQRRRRNRFPARRN